MTEKEVEQLKNRLINEISRNPDPKYGKDDKKSEVWKHFALGSAAGKQIYRSFSDSELLQYLCRTAEELNHAPTQAEVFWVFRDYIKMRFGKWPYALRAAGLSTSAGKGGKSLEQIKAEQIYCETLLEKVRARARELGKTPHPKDVPDTCRELKKYYGTWNSVIKAAGIDSAFFEKLMYKIEDLEPEYLNMLEEIRSCAYKIGRSPLHGEVQDSVKKALIQRCGSWRNALYQVDLSPVMRMQPFHDIYIDHRKTENRTGHTDSLYGCYYKVLNLSDEDRMLLDQVCRLRTDLGRVPMKKEAPRELRQALLKKCGSWGNVLYQIGITPKEYYHEKKKNSGKDEREGRMKL